MHSSPFPLLVTTKDIKCYNDDQQIELFDPEAPILIVLLRPNDSFKAMMAASLGIGESNTIYCACSNVWATYDEEIKDSGERVFKSGELYLKSRGQQKEKNIFNLGCEYIIKKYEDFKIELERKLKTKEIKEQQLKETLDKINSWKKKFHFSFASLLFSVFLFVNYQISDFTSIIPSILIGITSLVFIQQTIRSYNYFKFHRVTYVSLKMLHNMVDDIK